MLRPSPEPPGLRGEERVEQPVANLGGDSRAVVGHAERHAAEVERDASRDLIHRERRELHAHASTVRRRLHGVEREVEHGTMQQILVALDDEPLVRADADDFHVVWGDPGARRRDSPRRARRQRDRPARRGHAHAREVEKLRQETRQPIRFADDEVRERALVRVGARRATERFDRAPDRRERILDLVRERRAQLSDCLETLGARVQRVEALLVGDVLEDRGRRGGCRVAVALGARRVQPNRETPVVHA